MTNQPQWYQEHRAEIERSFTPENKLEKILKEMSPSQKYSVEISCYKTQKDIGRKNISDFSRGIICKGDTVVADIKRDHYSFFFSFVEDHPNGHDYFICGEDYQGQSVIELDTGKRKDYIPQEDFSNDFIWRGCKFNRASSLLIVDGFVWSCNSEFRFYDFSDPMGGWSELKTQEPIEYDKKWPEIGLDGTIQCFETDPALATSIKKFQRQGDKLLSCQ